MVDKDKYIKSGWHWSFAWLRRPELDEDFGYCYEDGDGDLIYSERADHQLVCYLDCYQDHNSGEKYLTMNPNPISAIVAAEKRFIRNAHRS
jgi:hypothetical protein